MSEATISGNKANGKQPSVNRVAIGETLAVLFCPASGGKVFGVTIDLADLPAALGYGPWRVANFDKARDGFGLYCYSTRRFNGKTLYLHRLLMNPPAGMEVDHALGRRLDNRRSQLRIATHGQNQRNKRKFQPNDTGFRSVRKTRSGKYVGRVWVNSKAKYLGVKDTAEEAAATVRQFLIASGADYASPSLIPNQQAGQQ